MDDLENEDSGLSLDDFEEVDRTLLTAADAAGMSYALVRVVKGIWRVFAVAEDIDQLVETGGNEIHDLSDIVGGEDA